MSKCTEAFKLTRWENNPCKPLWKPLWVRCGCIDLPGYMVCLEAPLPRRIRGHCDTVMCADTRANSVSTCHDSCRQSIAVSLEVLRDRKSSEAHTELSLIRGWRVLCLLWDRGLR